MLEGLVDYINAAIGAGYDFFVLVFPLILVFLLCWKLKQFYDEGFMLIFIASLVILGTSIGLSVYYSYNGGNFFIGLFIVIIGVAIWSFVTRKLTSKNDKSD